MIVKISKENYNQIVKQAKEEFPLECCGLLAGVKTDDEILIKKVYALTNIDQSSEHFSMDPKEQFAAIKQMRTDGDIVVGNYHSHPYTPSRPSEEDKRLAYDPKALYGILSLKDQEPVLNFFKITANELVEKLELLVI
ncbi:Mov34/MPN/PAD-1 family protein [Alkaliphilus metalliredigens QYMF]|uniref:Mov34/MPN/PAD-1 family protein n=1 Tax=Alkaliphilus metalliredigens (strain QYMF) TaxID=293826 RepID=A6TTW0_ALKMQ|nr:M67 family metallopeptidase [Alkaliphilus metalliredigens]ABR49628.1 Mov34/MPN/PAD-1 family protein [Alkaliphilus metalliredigens QYMF]